MPAISSLMCFRASRALCVCIALDPVVPSLIMLASESTVAALRKFRRHEHVFAQSLSTPAADACARGLKLLKCLRQLTAFAKCLPFGLPSCCSMHLLDQQSSISTISPASVCKSLSSAHARIVRSCSSALFSRKEAILSSLSFKDRYMFNIFLACARAPSLRLQRAVYTRPCSSISCSSTCPTLTSTEEAQPICKRECFTSRISQQDRLSVSYSKAFQCDLSSALGQGLIAARSPTPL
mmetsp:Transcript_64771/g.104835  ORF Transcript_64771/g.104835 Transcript_64771/m.104835 type:complete len:238 (-) Transcript_64771:2-715(-)